MNNRWLKFFKKWHRWPALVFSLFFLVWAISGIVLNHRGLFSSLDIHRKCLPEEYSYQNWNNAAVKGSIAIAKDSLLIFGNTGVWLTDSSLSRFMDFNRGFPKGTDNRKIFCLLRSQAGNLYAGTLFGLYYFDPAQDAWTPVPLEKSKERIVALLEKNGRIMVMSRSAVYMGSDQPRNLTHRRTVLPPPRGYDHREGVFRTFWVIHSGEIWGMAGRLLIDLAGIIMIILTITGMVHYIAPFVLKKRKRKKQKLERVSWWKRNAIAWHKKAGIWIALLLLINVVTGMFLRPPLLIGIADASMGKIPWSVLDSDNAWEDKLRDFVYDEELQGFLVSTSKGFFLADTGFRDSLQPLAGQPPVSVMGINVLRPVSGGTYLVGSFSGLYLWQPATGHAVDYFTGRHPGQFSTNSRPVSDRMVSGHIIAMGGREWYFDYNLGALPVHHLREFPPMPPAILDGSPMSCWNVALEFHTARIFKVVLGDFYILIIPLMGLSGAVLIISGTIVWLKLTHRKRHCKERRPNGSVPGYVR